LRAMKDDCMARARLFDETVFVDRMKRLVSEATEPSPTIGRRLRADTIKSG